MSAGDTRMSHGVYSVHMKWMVYVGKIDWRQKLWQPRR